MQAAFIHDDVILISAIHLNTKTADVIADIGISFLAGRAASAGKYGIQHHSIADLQATDSRAGFLDYTRKLMTHNPGQLHIGAAFPENMQIRAADTDGPYLYQHIRIPTNDGRWHIHYFDFPNINQFSTSHVASPTAVSRYRPGYRRQHTAHDRLRNPKLPKPGIPQGPSDPPACPNGLQGFSQ